MHMAYPPTPFHLGFFGDFERFERFRVLGLFDV